MGHVRQTAHIRAPMERVWDFLTDYARAPEWQTNVVEIGEFSGTPGEVGFRYEAVYRAMGRRMETSSEITRSERPTLLEEQGTMPGSGPVTMTSTLEPGADGGTNITYELDYELGSGLLSGIADRLIMERAIERDVRHSTENMKELIEAEAVVTA
jgi:uncharacterized protein YndB with AHSA1/START domain